MGFLRVGLEFALLQHDAHRLAETNDPKTISSAERNRLLALQQQKWLAMRRIARQEPLAINVGCVAWGSEAVFAAYGFKGAASVPKEVVDADEDGRVIGNRLTLPKENDN